MKTMPRAFYPKKEKRRVAISSTLSASCNKYLSPVIPNVATSQNTTSTANASSNFDTKSSDFFLQNKFDDVKAKSKKIFFWASDSSLEKDDSQISKTLSAGIEYQKLRERIFLETKRGFQHSVWNQN